jgi:DNA-binding transcriptional regulator YiaG
MRGLPLATSAGYVSRDQTYVIVGQILAGIGTTTIEEFTTVAPPQTNAGASAPEPSLTGDALSELRRLSGLSWEQLARMLGVSRRALHFWASGKAMARSNEEHLLEGLDNERNAVDLLAAREYERAGAASRLSAAARMARVPNSPESLVGALHDRVHEDLGPSRPARSVRVYPRK